MVTTITSKPPPGRRKITNDVRHLKVGQSVKTDEVQITSARTIANRIKSECAGTVSEGKSFNVTSRDGFIYITRVS